MAARPTWSGFLQISLVSIGVKIYPASTPGRPVQFHEIDRRTHQRVHHRNVDASGEVDRTQIVKGFEYRRGNYIEIDPQELRSLRLSTATTLPIQQFVEADEVPLRLFERPYFVVPRDQAQAKALAIMSRALSETGTFGIGKVTFSGREHLAAIGAPEGPKPRGLMLYLLRYAEELRDAGTVMTEVPDTSISSQELALAKQLIHSSTSKLDLSAYQDEYEAAVKKLVEAKRKGKPLAEPKAPPPRRKVVNIMDALRQSLEAAKAPVKKSSRRKKAA